MTEICVGQKTEPSLLPVKCNYFFLPSTTMIHSHFIKLTLAVHVFLLWLSPIFGALELFLEHIQYISRQIAMKT